MAPRQRIGRAVSATVVVGLLLALEGEAQAQGKIRFNQATGRSDRLVLKTEAAAASAIAPDVEGFRFRLAYTAGSVFEEVLSAGDVLANSSGSRWAYSAAPGRVGLRKLRIRSRTDGSGTFLYAVKLRLDADLAAIDPDRSGLSVDELSVLVVEAESGDDLLRLVARWERRRRGWRLAAAESRARSLYFGAARRVFVSSDCHAGDLGGVAGADASCQALAAAAGLGGTYSAWLADAHDGPAVRLPHASEPYVLVDGSVVALDWDDLTDGELLSAIDLDERAEPVAGRPGCGTAVWTNATAQGTTAVTDGLEFACLDWTLALFSRWGLTGEASSRGPAWSDGGPFALVRCSTPSRLYCFER